MHTPITNRPVNRYGEFHRYKGVQNHQREHPLAHVQNSLSKIAGKKISPLHTPRCEKVCKSKGFYIL